MRSLTTELRILAKRAPFARLDPPADGDWRLYYPTPSVGASVAVTIDTMRARPLPCGR
jgi:hypothetical protein